MKLEFCRVQRAGGRHIADPRCRKRCTSELRNYSGYACGLIAFQDPTQTAGKRHKRMRTIDWSVRYRTVDQHGYIVQSAL